MAIVFNCPQCNHPYKLKDELAGKRATCKNPDCRQVIQIPSANGLRISDLGGILPDDAGRDNTPMPTNPADVETAALAALRDSVKEQEDTAAEKAIPVVCPHCDHKWLEPFEKGGKNALCPNEECRQRVKVPLPKKGDAPHDWRSGATNKPTLAKENFEKPADVVDASAKVVSKAAWQEGGGAEQDLEPVSLKRRLFIYSLFAAPILAIAVGIWFFVTWRKSVGEEVQFKSITDSFTKSREELAPTEAPIFAAILELSAAEYALNPKQQEKDKALTQALKHITTAHSELQQAEQAARKENRNTGPERFAVAGELALATLGLGGADEQVKDGSRIRWVPEAPNGRPLRVNEKTHTVLQELQRTLGLLKDADFDTKAALARRLTRELAKKGQHGLALDFPGFYFNDPAETPEAKAIVALELFRSDRGSPEAKKVADELKVQLAGGAAGRNPTPASAQALWIILGTEKAPPIVAPPPSGTQAVTDPPRLAYVAVYLLQNKREEALELARRSGGSLTGQLRALALYAEWVPDAGPAIDSALAAITLRKEPFSGSVVLRLSQLAAAAGRADQARQLADLIPDEGQKIWAKGSAIQFAATVENKSKLEDTVLEVPDDSKKLRAGHAWGRLWQARQNTRAGSAGDATKGIAGWSKGTIQPFGQAGIALGQHDK